MARIDQLLASYKRYVSLPPKANLPLSQRVWFLVYPADEERRMVNRVEEFEIATKDAGRGWLRVDLTGAFADWMDTFDSDERDACLADSTVTKGYAETQFRDFVSARIVEAATVVQDASRANTVVAVTGLMELFDFIHVSAVVDELPADFQGTLLVFFPGERVANTYRFLDARAGWDYLAVPILPES